MPEGECHRLCAALEVAAREIRADAGEEDEQPRKEVVQHVEHRVGEQPPRRAEKRAQVIEKVMEHHQTHGKAAQSVHQLDAGGRSVPLMR